MIRVVLDTNVLISGTFWTGDSLQVIQLIRNQKVIGCTSTEILSEFGKVLQRDFNQTPEQIKYHLEVIIPIFSLAGIIPISGVVKDDPDDDQIIATALGAKADYIITQDQHLLCLQKYENIQMITPNEFLENFPTINK